VVKKKVTKPAGAEDVSVSEESPKRVLKKKVLKKRVVKPTPTEEETTPVEAPKRVKKVLKKRVVRKKPQVASKRILHAKKSLLGSRIISKILTNLELDFDKLADLSTIESEALSGKYDILLTDNELLPADISTFKDKIAIISLPDSTVTKESLNTMISKHRG
jgi:hypothetical protein